MVCIAAAASAIDALHYVVAPMVGRSGDVRGVAKGKAWAYHLGTFRAATNAASRWQADFEWLDRLRAAALHPQPQQHVPKRHPVLPTNVAVENLMFSIESATRAADLLIDILTALFDGEVLTDDLRRWGPPHVHVLEELRAIRAGVRAR
jgi:hypothetical protein